jgi:hypothetical protein
LALDNRRFCWGFGKIGVQNVVFDGYHYHYDTTSAVRLPDQLSACDLNEQAFEIWQQELAVPSRTRRSTQVPELFRALRYLTT